MPLLLILYNNQKLSCQSFGCLSGDTVRFLGDEADLTLTQTSRLRFQELKGQGEMFHLVNDGA